MIEHELEALCIQIAKDHGLTLVQKVYPEGTVTGEVEIQTAPPNPSLIMTARNWQDCARLLRMYKVGVRNERHRITKMTNG